MTYNPSIPQPSDRPSASRSQILTNFTQLNTVFGNNHGKFDAAKEQGKHLFLQMPEQTVDPTTAANEAALYTKQGPISAVTELFFRRESNGALEQLTGSIVVSSGSNYGITTPWGIKLNWGSATIGGGGSVTVTYAIPFTSAVQSLIATKQAVGFITSSVSVDRLSLSQCRLYESAGNVLCYFAIGV